MKKKQLKKDVSQNLLSKTKELNKYSSVYIDKEFALEIVPIIKLIMMNTDVIKKIAVSELVFFKRAYINHCNMINKETKLYKEIMKKAINETRYKIYMLLETLYDIINEDTLTWKSKWKIKSYNKIEYDEIKTNSLGIEMVYLEPKPEYIKKHKENIKTKKYNEKRLKMCYKWRDSNIKWYRKILKTINN